MLEIEEQDKKGSRISQNARNSNRALSSAEPYSKQQAKHTFSKSMRTILTMDEHLIGMEALCDRLGYRLDYFLKVGVTLGHV